MEEYNMDDFFVLGQFRGQSMVIQVWENHQGIFWTDEVLPPFSEIVHDLRERNCDREIREMCQSLGIFPIGMEDR